jgi:hypothetical protein
MNLPTTLQGRPFGPEQLAQIQSLLEGNSQWSRYRLSRELAVLWNWRTAQGQLKDMAARTLLLKVEEQGWIRLPERRRKSPTRSGQARVSDILPWVRVPHLASHILSRVGRRIRQDWLAKYQQPIWLLETFVDRQRFAGTCYRAANWIHLGQTKGRGRQGGNGQWTSIKDVYVWPLHRNFRRHLTLTQTPAVPPSHDCSLSGQSLSPGID